MNPYWKPASFSDVKQGDYIRLFSSENVSWSLPTIVVDEVKEGAVKYRGAWYYESDDWSVELVNPAFCLIQ